MAKKGRVCASCGVEGAQTHLSRVGDELLCWPCEANRLPVKANPAPPERCGTCLSCRMGYDWWLCYKPLYPEMRS